MIKKRPFDRLFEADRETIQPIWPTPAFSSFQMTSKTAIIGCQDILQARRAASQPRP
jgi:hypothetical protein